MHPARGLDRLVEALPRRAFRAGAPSQSTWLLSADGGPWHVFDERTANRAYDDFVDLHVGLGHRGRNRRRARARLWLHSQGERNVWLRLGNTGPVEVRLGDRLVTAIADRRAERDAHRIELDLPSGWCVLQLDLTSEVPPWGFYARLTDERGREPSGLTTTLAGPGALEVTTPTLPGGHVGWPYVELANRRPSPRASPFRLMAGGGRPPYRWDATGLPSGLTVSSVGDIAGAPGASGDHEVVFGVTDSAGERSVRVFTLTVTEPPTRWYEHAALGAFVHFDKPEAVPLERWDAELAGFERHAEQWVELCAAAGASVLVLTAKHHDSWANWPTQAVRSDGVPAKRTGTNTLAAVREACLARGMRFGLYYSIFDTWHPGYRHDLPDYLAFQFAQMEELVDSYEPSVVWLDGHWESPRQQWEYDSLLSLIHARVPECVVMNNPGRRTFDVSDFGRGDVDVRTFEGHSPLEHMPRPQRRGRNPKPLPAEKLAFTCDWWAPGPEPRHAECSRNVDTAEWVQALSATVAAGGTLAVGLGPGYPGAPANAPAPGELHRGAAELLTSLGEWLADGRREAFEGVGAGPVAGRWGASVRRGDLVYLHLSEQAPARLELALPGPLTATLLPTGAAIPCATARGRTVLDLRGVPRDPMLTLVRLQPPE